MSEVASAYVSLLPSAKGFGKSTQSILNGELSGTGDSVGKSVGSKMSTAMGKTLKAGALGVAAGAVAVAGTALVKGFSRLQGIEQAEAKLKGLGHSAESVAAIMTNATAAVTGTAFGLDSAASVAASAVAAGVKPGKDLERTLSLVADASTIAGTSMDEMGLIFNKVAGTGKVQGEVLQQLGERGIPILQLLGKQLKATPAEVSKMASEGKIGFEQFQAAMEAGMGGAAQESGKTFSGALANMNAALGRLGARVLDGAFQQMPGLFTAAGNALDKLAPVAERVGSLIGSGLSAAIDLGKDAFARLQPVIDSIKSAMSDMAGRLEPVATWFRENPTVIKGAAIALGAVAAAVGVLSVAMGVLSIASSPITGVILLIGAIGGAVAYAYQNSETFRNGVQALGAQLKIVGDWIVTNALPVLQQFAAVIAQKLKPVWDALVDVFQTRVMPAMRQIGAKFVEWQPTIQRIVTTVVKLYGEWLKFQATVVGKVLPVIIRLAGWLLSKLVPAVLGVIGVVIKVVSALITFGTAVYNAGKRVITFAQTVGKQIGKVINWFTELPGKVKGALSDAASWLVNTGKDIVRGLLDGLETGRQWIIDKVKALGDLVPEWLQKKLGIASPSKVTKALGRWTALGLARGIDSGAPDVKKSMGNTVAGAMKSAGDNVEKGVKSLREQLKAAKVKLAGIMKNIDLFGSVRDSVRSAFSPDLLGGSLAEFLKNSAKQLATNNAVQGALDKFKGMEGVNKKFLEALMSSGNSGLILSLAGGSPDAFKQAQKDWLAVQSSAANLGTSAAEGVTGATLKAQLAEQRKTNKLIADLDKKIGDRINGGARKGRRNRRR